jgi:lysophospholipase L1-like esterase
MAPATGGSGSGGGGSGGRMTGSGGALVPASGGAIGTGTGGARASTGGAPGPAARTGGTAPPPRPDAGTATGGSTPPAADAGKDATPSPPLADASAVGDVAAPISDGAFPLPAPGSKPTVYIAGDSTVSTYAANANMQQGWGQRIQEHFTTDVIFVNKAIGGESSKSFIDQGHLDEILKVIKPGDYLFAQWGINDRSVAGPDRATDPATTFRTYLKQYIDGARGKNAIPVLVTPTPRHQFANGVFQNGFPEYCAAIKAVGTETNTPVVDLQSRGLAYYTMIGDAMVSSTISLDALHFKAEGANQMARLVSEGVKDLGLPISQYVK